MRIETPHLLITDDDRDFRETFSHAFGARGFRISQAADGFQALEILRSLEIHVILIDLQMPGLSGLETLEQARQEREPLPSILVSGALDGSVMAEAQRMNLYSVLAKPVAFSLAAKTVLQALRDVYRWRP